MRAKISGVNETTAGYAKGVIATQYKPVDWSASAIIQPQGVAKTSAHTNNGKRPVVEKLVA